MTGAKSFNTSKPLNLYQHQKSTVFKREIILGVVILDFSLWIPYFYRDECTCYQNIVKAKQRLRLLEKDDKQEEEG